MDQSLENKDGYSHVYGRVPWKEQTDKQKEERKNNMAYKLVRVVFLVTELTQPLDKVHPFGIPQYH